MESILKKIYNGEIIPADEYIKKNEEIRRMRRNQYKHYEDFISKLSKLTPPLDKEFIRIMEEQIETLPFEFEDAFINGFQIGARIMIEVFDNDFAYEGMRKEQ